ncbi:CLUMA_CG018725, isoform A [Clunio marinus]|uniref:CLUMA_CG018725, isoform A n=1 Tax=Clunio marinus TaxID=568069 RepID=A0A1J1IZR2_9DIPT|nr:CLUMA_CG018725, isoform A [Clunio marinus]
MSDDSFCFQVTGDVMRTNFILRFKKFLFLAVLKICSIEITFEDHKPDFKTFKLKRGSEDKLTRESQLVHRGDERCTVELNRLSKSCDELIIGHQMSSSFSNDAQLFKRYDQQTTRSTLIPHNLTSAVLVITFCGILTIHSEQQSIILRFSPHTCQLPRQHSANIEFKYIQHVAHTSDILWLEPLVVSNMGVVISGMVFVYDFNELR